MEYKALSFVQALENFKQIQFLSLGIESRADWIANILLYIPLSFLCLASFQQSLKNSGALKLLFALITLLFCLATAVGVEFTQQFFPPRTVSLNDLIAETLGSIIGIVVWWGLGERISNYVRLITLGNWLSIKAAIIFYLPVYIFFSLFPFDFVASVSELENKLDASQDSWFIDYASCSESPFRCGIKSLVEILILVPLGGLFAALPYVPNKKGLALVVGFLLGISIEFVQLFIYSASAQGVSILTRMLGMALGVKLLGHFSQIDLQAIRPYLKKGILIALVPYLLTVITINGWFEGDWLSQAAAQQKLSETHFLPFYYFYYTTETIALVSLLSNIGTYIPVGIFYWVYGLQENSAQKINGFWVGLSAAFLATIIELGKLFLKAKHIDPTDIIIAFIAALTAYALLNAVETLINKSQDHPAAVDTVLSLDSIHEQHKKSPGLTLNKFNSPLVGILLTVILYKIYQYPLLPICLLLFIAGYAYFLYRNNFVWLLALPALLPIMDFSPWTGQFFFDEYDLTILCTLLVLSILRKSDEASAGSYRFSDYWIMGIFLGVTFISFILGVWPLAAIDDNAFSNYYSNYNALRVGKGFLWAGLLAPYLVKYLGVRSGRNWFSYGMLSGLLSLTIFSLVERWVFAGLFDFSLDYRINGLFATMHTGGGHIESYLALTMPFITVLFIDNKKPLLGRMLGFLLFILSFYTLLMTFSRGGLVGLFIAFLALMAGLYIHFKKAGQRPNLQIGLLLGLPLILMVILAIPVINGDLMQNRIKLAGHDSETRHKHWYAAIDMMDGDILSQAFGMGLGSFPRTFFWSNAENANPATYRIESENGNQYLALRGGDALYMGQYITLQNAPRPFKLRMDVRSSEQNIGLSVPICEKSLQYSFRCVSSTVKVTSTQWQRVENKVDTGAVGTPSSDIASGWLTRPVQLALFAGNEAGKIIEVDNLSLLDANGVNLISNGDFSKGTDRWFFATEKHNPWHIFNIWIQVLFDMGWIGLCVFVFLMVYLYYRLIKSLKEDIYAAILLSSFTGFLIIGYVDSPFDAPRLTFLFFLLVIFAIFSCKRPAKSLRSF